MDRKEMIKILGTVLLIFIMFTIGKKIRFTPRKDVTEEGERQRPGRAMMVSIYIFAFGTIFFPGFTCYLLWTKGGEKSQMIVYGLVTIVFFLLTLFKWSQYKRSGFEDGEDYIRIWDFRGRETMLRHEDIASYGIYAYKSQLYLTLVDSNGEKYKVDLKMYEGPRLYQHLLQCEERGDWEEIGSRALERRIEKLGFAFREW
ncbi:MAG: hypothetical protein Q4Q17_05120 [Tissierellia bacterium]|nr:hypothetical protein [Tissierellia bacterium]